MGYMADAEQESLYELILKMPGCQSKKKAQ